MNKKLLFCTLTVFLQTIQAGYFKTNYDILNEKTQKLIQTVQDLMDATDGLQKALESQGIRNIELFAMEATLRNHFEESKKELERSNRLLHGMIVHAETERELFSDLRSLKVVIDTIASSQLLLGMLVEISKQATKINVILRTLLPKKPTLTPQGSPLFHHRQQELVNHEKITKEKQNINWNDEKYCTESPVTEDDSNDLGFSSPSPSSEYIATKAKNMRISTLPSMITKK